MLRVFVHQQTLKQATKQNTPSKQNDNQLQPPFEDELAGSAASPDRSMPKQQPAWRQANKGEPDAPRVQPTPLTALSPQAACPESHWGGRPLSPHAPQANPSRSLHLKRGQLVAKAWQCRRVQLTMKIHVLQHGGPSPECAIFPVQFLARLLGPRQNHSPARGACEGLSFVRPTPTRRALPGLPRNHLPCIGTRKASKDKRSPPEWVA